MKFKMTKDEYLLLKDFITLNDLDLEIVSVVMDEQLYNLGFADKIPCIVELDATEEVIEKATEIAMWYEVNAFNTPDGRYPKENDKDNILYKKYGWIWDLFNSDYWECKE